MKIRLRYLLAILFTIVATVPVLVLGLWVERTALKQEIAAVWEKHLLLADNAAGVLDQYSHDLEEGFHYLAGLKGRRATPTGALVLARHLGIRDFYILGAQGRILRKFGPGGSAATDLSSATLATLLKLTDGDLVYSRVMPDQDGRPTIFMVERLDRERTAIAAIGTDFFVRLQSAITFGKNGHAAIVDADGNIIAHPNRAWQKAIKNLIEVTPVRKMAHGDTGITRFFSPATQTEMISGFTTVPRAGWGVTVQQPIGELEERAEGVIRIAVIVAIIGILAAALLSFLLAGRLTRPVDSVRQTARRIADGKLTSRVPALSPMVTPDLRELSDDFNDMAQRIQDDQKTLAEALSQAQSADRAKTKFLANMSHELRTPLNAVIGFSETIENELFGTVGNKRYREYAADIRRSGEHLLSIINDILDLSKIEAGQVDLEDDIVDIETLLTDAESMIKDQAGQAAIRLEIDIQEPLPALRGSEVKLKQVLVNLLTNAVKYTPQGGLVSLSACPDHGGGIAISVTDSGIGMSRQEQLIARIPFGRVDSGFSQKVGGAGLGLPLATQFVEIHGGRLEIESEEGVGTTVIIHLPAARVVSKVA